MRPNVMTPKCLTTIVDILLSLVLVGIPEISQSAQPSQYGVHQDSDKHFKLPHNPSDPTQQSATAHQVQKGGGGLDVGCVTVWEEGKREWAAGDHPEGLALDGTLALDLNALRNTSWPVILYVLERLAASELRARQVLVQLLLKAHQIDAHRFVQSVCSLSRLHCLARTCACMPFEHTEVLGNEECDDGDEEEVCDAEGE